ncbi:MAG: glycosyltransferase [Verrucomicrobia bacterium]|nr:glycosyltransferase [Verrucomicrobiota bacterium]
MPNLIVAGPIQTATWTMACAGASPLVAMSWGSDLLVDARSNANAEQVTRVALEHSSALLGDCHAVQIAASSFVPFSDDKVFLLPWGLDDPGQVCSDSYRDVLRHELGWRNCLVVISARSWESVYDIESLIGAFARCHRQYPCLRLLLLGDGSHAASIRERIAKEGVTDFVYMPGRVSQANLSSYYQCADLYITSALSDGTSVSLLEAMSHGLPVVGAGAYGNLEWIDSGRGGWLFQPGDEMSMANALGRAISCADQFKERGAWNRQLVISRANWRDNSSKMLAFLAHIATGQ